MQSENGKTCYLFQSTPSLRSKHTARLHSLSCRDRGRYHSPSSKYIYIYYYRNSKSGNMCCYSNSCYKFHSLQRFLLFQYPSQGYRVSYFQLCSQASTLIIKFEIQIIIGKMILVKFMTNKLNKNYRFWVVCTCQLRNMTFLILSIFLLLIVFPTLFRSQKINRSKYHIYLTGDTSIFSLYAI